jgi:acetoacetyl-CoA synthetase
MEKIREGTVLWEPSAERISRSRMSAFAAWLESSHSLAFAGYSDIWRWSVDHLEEFWSCVWDYFELPPRQGHGPVLLRGKGAEGARWFPGEQLNYVDLAMRHPPGASALVACDEDVGPGERLTYGELRDRVASAAAGLSDLGVRCGDRVAAVLPNGVHAVVAFLATASLGAVWSSCAPEFGAPSMVERFRQIEPTVLIAAAGYRYRGRYHDLREKLARLEAGLPHLSGVVIVPDGQSPDRDDLVAGPAAKRSPGGAGATKRLSWDELLAEYAELDPEPVEFSHPLWILYSSGTTGLPKPIVHGHGGIVLEHLKSLVFHSDLGSGDRFFWFTTTGWMMWNYLVGGLLAGSAIVCYDGDPTWPDDWRLWELAREVGITYFGTSAPYIEQCRRAGISPRAIGGLEIHTVGSTGSPLSPEGFAWASAEIGDDVLVGSVSGGTDVCTGFLASSPWLEVRAGELQCRALGAKVEAFDELGRAVVDQVGELVVTEPMPSMPVGLWGDEEGSRLHESYFGHFPGVWRHGDWVKITAHGSAVVYGRSDATLNRAGVRSGTAEFYRAVEGMEEVADALVVDTSELGRRGELVLFVVPSGGRGDGEEAPPLIDEALDARIRAVVRDRLSPRHVPDRIIAVSSLPRTLNGKKVEVPVRRILGGAPVEKAVSADALADSAALDGLLEAISKAGLA